MVYLLKYKLTISHVIYESCVWSVYSNIKLNSYMS